MRVEYDAELEDVSRVLVEMADEVRGAMGRATVSLLTADAEQAERVISGDAVVNGLRQRVEDRVYGLLARQSPVASDLRLLFTALHIATDLERMGDLAKHVAKIGLRRHPCPAVPEELVVPLRPLTTAVERTPPPPPAITSGCPFRVTKVPPPPPALLDAAVPFCPTRSWSTSPARSAKSPAISAPQPPASPGALVALPPCAPVAVIR